MKQQIDENKTILERDSKDKKIIEEERKEMADTLKTNQKSVKKNKEIIQEIVKLEGSDLKVLQAEVGVLHGELDELKEEWNEFKKPIADELANEKQDIADKRVEYQYKIEKISDIKKEVKEAIEEM